MNRKAALALALAVVLFTVSGLGFVDLVAQTTGEEKDQDYYEDQAYKIYSAGTLKELKQLVDEGLRAYPQSAYLLDFDAVYYSAVKDFDKALSAAHRAAQIKPTARRSYHLGRLYFEGSKDYEKALDYFNESEITMFTSPGFYYFKGECYRNLGQLDKAKSCYNESANSDSGEEFRNMSRTQLAKLQPDGSTAPPDRDTTGIRDTATFAGPSDPPQPDCCFHIWAAGCNLGWSTSLLKYTRERTRWEAPDQTTVQFMTRIGVHVKAAYFTCSKMNPAWADWKDKKSIVDRQVTRFRNDPDKITRRQVWNAFQGLTHWSEPLKRQVAYYDRPETAGHKPACGEKYFLLGRHLCYAQQSLKIAAEIRGQGRNDWQPAVDDGFFHLQKAQEVLEAYYLVQSGQCVEIKDLRPKERVHQIRQPQNSTAELDDRIGQLDKLIGEIQQRMLDKCVACDQGKGGRESTPPVPPTANGDDLLGTWAKPNDVVEFKREGEIFVGKVVRVRRYLLEEGWRIGAVTYRLRHMGGNRFEGIYTHWQDGTSRDLQVVLWIKDGQLYGDYIPPREAGPWGPRDKIRPGTVLRQRSRDRQFYVEKTGS